jgi:hypothetical protein
MLPGFGGQAEPEPVGRLQRRSSVLAYTGFFHRRTRIGNRSGGFAVSRRHISRSARVHSDYQLPLLFGEPDTRSFRTLQDNFRGLSSDNVELRTADTGIHIVTDGEVGVFFPEIRIPVPEFEKGLFRPMLDDHPALEIESYLSVVIL